MKEQCTGNTQRLPPPPAAGVTAGASLFLFTHQRTPNDAHAKNTNSGMQKSTTTLRRTHALPPVVLLFSLPAHPHITPHSRRIPRRRIHNGSNTSAGTAVGRELISNCPRHPKCHTTQLLHTANRTTATRRRDKSRTQALLARAATAGILYVRSQHSRRSTACAKWRVFVVCVSKPTLAEQLCRKRESEESNGRKKRIAHTQLLI
ncbi:hypothetical protein Tc00.1047053460061.10, partial [Trypanosoma cruzi]